MRLQCPNCDAEYEVDTSAIPPEGRDVQCSNCGHGWFQIHPDYEPDHDLDAALFETPPPLPQVPPSDNPYPKREIDPAALQILREEAAREEAMRAADQARAAQMARPATPMPPITPQPPAPPLRAPAPKPAEMQAVPAAAAPAAAPQPEPAQPAMAPTAPPPADDRDFEASLDALRDQELPMPRITTRVTHHRIARLRGEPDAPPVQPEPVQPEPVHPAYEAEFADPAPNQDDDWPSFAPVDDRAHEADLRSTLAPEAQVSGSGRRAGMLTAMLAAVLAVSFYVMGPDLAARLPALAGPLAAYTDGINGLRDSVQMIVPAAIDFAKGAIQTARGWIAG